MEDRTYEFTFIFDPFDFLDFVLHYPRLEILYELFYRYKVLVGLLLNLRESLHEGPTFLRRKFRLWCLGRPFFHFPFDKEFDNRH